jgi:hypothetical protein
MYLGLGLRLGSGTFAGFDADAAAYFDRAGVTDATAKSQINAFVKGVKGFGSLQQYGLLATSLHTERWNWNDCV